MHGPDVMQHYLVSRHNPNCGMIDMSHFLRQVFTAAALEAHVFRDTGGTSQAVLHDILDRTEQEPQFVKYQKFQEDDDPARFAELFDMYGPALVSKFRVYSSFCGDALRHTGAHLAGSESDKPAYHAMVVVGYRMEGSHVLLLIQNWWQTKQFFEADLAYLFGCGAEITFVRTPQARIPTTFRVTTCMYAETDALDMAERPWCDVER